MYRKLILALIAGLALVPMPASAGEPTQVYSIEGGDGPFYDAELSAFCGEPIDTIVQWDYQIISLGDGRAHFTGQFVFEYTDAEGNSFLDRIVWADHREFWNPETGSEGVETEQLLAINWHYRGLNGVWQWNFTIDWDTGEFTVLRQHPYPFDVEFAVVNGWEAPWEIVCTALAA